MKEFPISLLDSFELYTSSKRIHDMVLATLSADTYVKSLCLQISGGNTDMEKAMGKALKSNFTSILLEADGNRDDSFLGSKNFFHAYTYHKDPEKRAAAKILDDIITTVGRNIHRLGYMDQTAKMNALIDKLTVTEVQQNLTTIGGVDWYTELVNSQKNFETTYQSKVGLEAQIDFPLLKDSKRKITSALVPLLSYIESNAAMKTDKFEALEGQLDEIITAAVAVARARITRIEKEKEEAAQKKEK